ncbi:MlaE family ABC transporter permease [Haliangium sp.]|uniref:MlaE family ABC transporter permease n=1 Tax=Haliangium sp. TaxID=2663208 RepID=UPI003D0F6B00
MSAPGRGGVDGQATDTGTVGPPGQASSPQAGGPEAPAPGATKDQAGADPTSVGRAVAVGVRDALLPVVRLIDALGAHVILCVKALSWLPRRPLRLVNYLEAAEYIGVGSLPIILLVGTFTGAVMCLQSVFAFRQFGLESMAGGVTGLALATELAPVLGSLMLAGRAGSGIATEIGTMRISEQIDALESMAVNPIQFLILPRLVAGTFMAPVLTLLFFIVGMGGAYIVAVLSQGVDHGQFVASAKDLIEFIDVVQGLLKSCVFGFVLVLIGCYQGYHATGGGRGVGLGTTRAVVIASVTVLILDYILSNILLVVLPN